MNNFFAKQQVTVTEGYASLGIGVVLTGLPWVWMGLMLLFSPIGSGWFAGMRVLVDFFVGLGIFAAVCGVVWISGARLKRPAWILAAKAAVVAIVLEYLAAEVFLSVGTWLIGWF